MIVQNIQRERVTHSKKEKSQFFLFSCMSLSGSLSIKNLFITKPYTFITCDLNKKQSVDQAGLLGIKNQKYDHKIDVNLIR